MSAREWWWRAFAWSLSFTAGQVLYQMVQSQPHWDVAIERGYFAAVGIAMFAWDARRAALTARKEE